MCRVLERSNWGARYGAVLSRASQSYLELPSSGQRARCEAACADQIRWCRVQGAGRARSRG